MAFFRRTTMHNTVIMGRKTHDSIGGCLKGRSNLVLSHRFDLFPSTDQCKLVNSVEETMAAALLQGGEESYVIGGAATYSAFSPYVDRYLVTLVDHIADDADAFLASEIMSEFQGWSASQVAAFPQSEGLDQFAFKIMRFDAPDALERQEHRKAVANQSLARAKATAAASPRRKGPIDKSAQAVFSF